MQFDNGGKAFISFSRNNDDTVTLKVNRGLIFKKEAETIPVKVTLVDDKESKTLYIFNVVIKYQDKSKKADDAEDQEDTVEDGEDAKEPKSTGNEAAKEKARRKKKKVKEELGKIKKTIQEKEKKEPTENEFDDSLGSLGLSKDEQTLLK